MKTGVKYVWLVLIIVGTLFFWQPGHAQNPALEKVGDHGSIDWVAQKVVAKGVGAPPQKYYGKPQARPLAQRAAITDARRNLLEVIKGVHVDSTTVVNNWMVKDDAIVTRVQGLIQNSRVDNIQYMSDGTVEAVISMPLSGQLGEALIQMTLQPPGAAPGAANVEARIRQLEYRVKSLENKLSGLKQITHEQEQMILFFRQFVTAWLDYTASHPVMVQAAQYGAEDKFAGLKKKLEDQEARLASLSTRLEEMAGRLSRLESTGAKPAPAVVKAKTEDIYSGLVIDARKTGFRPCLKPEIFAKGKLVYPGGYVDMKTAVRKGYVRYYRQIGRAQQSARVGKLPYTINAKGTWKGKRNLEIGGKAYGTLKPLMDVPGNFLATCKVVIVF
jgi:uncharacterized coiled-coil protein SlyX